MPKSNLLIRTLSALVMLLGLIAIAYAGEFYVKLLVSALLILTLFEIINIPFSTKNSLAEFNILKIGFLIYCCFSIYFFLKNYGTYKNSYILFLVSLVCLNDAGAYFIGSLLKGPKPFKNISPKKTISGYIGGILCALVGLKILSFYYVFSFNTSVLHVFALSLSAHFGDLLESGFKRKMNIKDTGNIIPGHGGILDRIDSILFTNYTFYLFCM